MKPSSIVEFRPAVEMLDNRLQPGSMLSSGTNLSLVGLPLAAGLLPDVAGLEMTAHVRPTTEPTAAPLAHVTSPESVISDQPAPAVSGLPATITAVAAPTPEFQPVLRSIPSDSHVPPPPGTSDTLWYNGDYDGRNGLASEMNTLVADARTYDDFNVTDDNGWDLTHVWGNFQMTAYPEGGANFEIRAGVSAGNGGTVVASGANMPVTLTPHQAGHLLDITVDVALTDAVHLDPGTYWLTVQPVGGGSGRAFVSTTSGANAVGDPAGNNGNSFFDSSVFPFNFAPTTSPLGQGTWDFSYGVGGSVTQPPHSHGALNQ